MARTVTGNDATTTIRIKRTTKEKLSSIGQKGQTYDDIVSELIESDKGCTKSTKKILSLIDDYHDGQSTVDELIDGIEFALPVVRK